VALLVSGKQDHFDLSFHWHWQERSVETDMDEELIDVNIRLADESDVPALAKLRYDLRSSTGSVSEPEPEFLRRCDRWMREHLKAGSFWQCWVAEQDQQLIGNLWLQLVEKIPNPRSEPEYHAYVTSFYIQEPARGKGIGTRLLETALEWCRATKVHAVILWPTDRSRSLYERYGFAVRSDLLELIISDSASENDSSRSRNPFRTEVI
jgi:GNAT superfamily N-acetyltransferase